MEKGTNWWSKWELAAQNTGEGVIFGWGKDSTILWEGKVDAGKFIGRIVGSLVSFTYSYFKKVFSSSSE